MKKHLYRIVAVVLIAALCTTSFAQPRRGGARHHDGWENFDRSLRTVNNVASTAMLFAGIAQFDSYTGIRFGYNAASLRCTGGLEDYVEGDIMSGINLGVVFGWNLGNSNFILEPGVYYSMKGGKLTPTSMLSGYDYSASKTRMHELEIPLVLKYNINLSDDLNLQPFAGGFMAFGLGGKVKYEGTGNEYDTFGDDGFRNFDAGLRFGVGMSVDHFYVELGYDLGLVSQAADNYEDYGYDSFNEDIYTGNLNISMGFNF